MSRDPADYAGTVWLLRDQGKNDHQIAAATGLHVIDVRRILAKPRPRA